MGEPARSNPASNISPPGTPSRPEPRPVAAVPSRTAPQQQSTRRLGKGQLLFGEGENSRAMYFIKTGMIRLFKKKGEAVIELDTIRSGSVVGELAFLDGQPRSASAEALTDCELVEISGPVFQQVLSQIPDWLKILLKTVVGRLRASSTRIRQLESASTAYDYNSRDGKRSAHYVYLSANDCLKILTAILLVSTRNGAKQPDGLEVRVGLLQRYANQIMGIPVAKITTMMDILAQAGAMIFDENGAESRVVLRDADFLEQFIAYLNEENLLEPEKRHDLSPRSFLIMSMMFKHLARAKRDATGASQLNIAEIAKLEAAAMGGKEAFRMDELQELIKLKYVTPVNIKNSDEATTQLNAENFVRAYRFQRVVIGIAAMNEQKRKNSR